MHDFFGRDWAKAFNGAGASHLEGRLDGGEFARVRPQLTRTYSARFQSLDPGVIPAADAGSWAPAAPDLLRRLVMPDVMVQDAGAPDDGFEQRPAGEPAREDGMRHFRGKGAATRRVSVDVWASGADQLALVGDAGMGKSLTLRCIALDLLGDQTTFPGMSRK